MTTSSSPILYAVADKAYHNAIQNAPKILRDNPKLAAPLFAVSGAYDATILTQKIIGAIAPKFYKNTLPKIEKACIVGLALGLTTYLLTTGDSSTTQYNRSDAESLETCINDGTCIDDDYCPCAKTAKTHVYRTNPVYTSGMIFAGLGAIVAASRHISRQKRKIREENYILERKRKDDEKIDEMIYADSIGI